MWIERHLAKLIVLLLVLQTVISGLIVSRLNAMARTSTAAVNTVAAANNVPSATARLAPEVAAIDTAGRPARGAEHPELTVVEFSDVTCSACRTLQPVLDRFVDEHPERVRHVVQPFPLRPEGKSIDLALAAECAHRQNAFWPMQAALFEDEAQLSTADDVHAVAKDLGLHASDFAACFADAATHQVIAQNVQLGRRLGVDGTPTLFINGRRFLGLPTFDDLNVLLTAASAVDS